LTVSIECKTKKGRRFYKNNDGVVVSAECHNCKEIKNIDDFPKHSSCNNTGRRAFCKPCHKERKSKYYYKNRDSLKYYHKNKTNEEYMKKRAEWREDNKEHLGQYNKNWHQENKDSVRKRKRKYCNLEDVKTQRSEYMKAYRETDRGREAIKRSIYNRRVARNNAPNTIDFNEAINTFKSRFGNVCAFTGIEMIESSVEHVLPVSHGGGNTDYNIIPTELIVNCWKTNRNVFEFIEFLCEEIDFSFFFEKTIPYLSEKMNKSVDEYVDWYNSSYKKGIDLNYHTGVS
jgi:hypothetical protein